MKRLLHVVLLAALLGAAPLPAHAAAPETDGELRVRAWSLDNYYRDGDATEFWDQRLRLGLDWQLAERVWLQVRADVLEGFWGESEPAATRTFTLPPPGQPPPAPQPPGATVPLAETRRQIDFDLANLRFVWPGTPVLVSVGRQEITWGTGFWVRSDYRDRFQVAAKLDPVVIVVAYDKFTEVFQEHDTKDDQRGWAVGAVADAAGFQFGLLAAFLKDESRTRFPAADLSYAAGDAFLKGKLGPASLQAEVTYGGGTIDRGALGDLDAAGLGGYAGVFVPVGPTVTVGLEGAYARGDDPGTPDRHEGFFAADYQGPYWSVVFYNNMDYPGYAADSQTSSRDLDFSVRNAATGKLSAVFRPTGKLSITGAALYAAADQVRDGVDRAMGWEYDLIAAWEITEQVSFTAGAGYAVLGDYWKSAPISGGDGRRPDNPLVAVAAFTTRF